MRTLLYRPAEVIEPKWSRVADVHDDDVTDQLASWQGPTLFHGDLVLVAGGDEEVIYVFDGDRGALARAPEYDKKDSSRTWSEKWDSRKALPWIMIHRSHGVSPAKVIAATYEVVNRVTITSFGGYGFDQCIEEAHGAMMGRSPERSLDLAFESASKLQLKFEDAERYGFAAQAMASAASGFVGAVEEYVSLQRNASVVGTGATLVGHASHAVRMACAAESVALSPDGGAARKQADRDVNERASSIVRRHIPLSTILCARLGIRDPLPMPQENPSGARR